MPSVNSLGNNSAQAKGNCAQKEDVGPEGEPRVVAAEEDRTGSRQRGSQLGAEGRRFARREDEREAGERRGDER